MDAQEPPSRCETPAPVAVGLAAGAMLALALVLLRAWCILDVAGWAALAGCPHDGLLHKPFELDELLAAVARLCPPPRA